MSILNYLTDNKAKLLVDLGPSSSAFFTMADYAMGFSLNQDTIDTIFDLTQNILISDMIPYCLLPYESCCFEFPVKLDPNGKVATNLGSNAKAVFMCGVVGDSIYLSSGIASKNGVWFDDSDLYITNGGYKLVSNRADMESIEVAQERGQNLIRILYAINCKDLVTTQKVDFSKINKKREKNGKTPLREYTVITIKLGDNNHKRSEGESSRSPRAHLRRGHFRNLPNKVVWVRNCAVGVGHRTKQRYEVTN